MHRRARLIGTVVAAVGVAVLVTFSYYGTANFWEFRKQQMFFERNPGNAMYELQYRGASAGLAFMIGGAIAGALLTLNGLTWIALGGVARQLERERGAVR
jgi:hypothetical protein